jgi:hypothetical protein
MRYLKSLLRFSLIVGVACLIGLALAALPLWVRLPVLAALVWFAVWADA